MDIDTASSASWMFLSVDPKLVSSDKYAGFDIRRSATSRLSSERWSLSREMVAEFIGGPKFEELKNNGYPLSGNVGFDDVVVGNATIHQQAIRFAEVNHGDFSPYYNVDGILGLGLQAGSSVGAHATILESMTKQRLLSKNLFTINLGTDPFFTFGFIDETKRGGRDIHWVDVDAKRGFWQFSSGIAEIGNQVISRPLGSSAIADTASSFILTNPDIVDTIYSKIDGATFDEYLLGWKYPTGSAIPTIAFAVGNDDTCLITIDPRDMAHTHLEYGSWIYGTIQVNPAYDNDGAGFDVFGTPFLKKLYAIFDFEHLRFGAIPLPHSSPAGVRNLIIHHHKNRINKAPAMEGIAGVNLFRRPTEKLKEGKMMDATIVGEKQSRMREREGSSAEEDVFGYAR
jgi:hypothetical protein